MLIEKMLLLQMDLWFGGQTAAETDFDRMANLKAHLFDMFADHTGKPSQLDYVSLVSVYIHM